MPCEMCLSGPRAGARVVIDSLAVPGIVEDEVRWAEDAMENWRILRSCAECEE
jgi:hypothetical protein